MKIMVLKMYEYDKIRMYQKKEELLAIGKEYIKEVDLEAINNKKAYKEEICSGSNLDRGFYNPSPVIDTIVGGYKRGHLLKTLRVRSDTYHHYYWNKENRLEKVERYYGGTKAETEYLFYDIDTVIGVTVDKHGFNTVSEEKYRNGSIESYSVMHCDTFDGTNYTCFDFRKEEYIYTGSILSECIVQRYAPIDDYYWPDRYKLYYMDGKLVEGHIIK